MLQLYNAGKSIHSLCNEFDLKFQTVYVLVRQYNIVDNPQLSGAEIENIKLKKLLAEKDSDIVTSLKYRQTMDYLSIAIKQSGLAAILRTLQYISRSINLINSQLPYL